MMKRREFATTLAAGTVGAAVAGTAMTLGNRAQAAPAGQLSIPRPVQLKVGCQSRNSTDEAQLEFLARHGVYHMNPGNLTNMTLDSIKRQQDEAARYGIEIGAYHLPLTSGGIDRIATPNIMLGRSPERDREIESIQEMIRMAGEAGVPRLMYNLTILPVTRTGRTVDPGRGNVSYSTWNQEEAYARGLHQELTVAGVVDIDTIYERITYLLDRILPVAEEYDVRLGNHIADPPLPAGYRGITRWNSPDVFAGIRRFAELYDSPAHGFNFCVGSTAEGLTNPSTEIFPIIDYMGSRKQIVNVHLRNIKGGWGNFQEVYPDNGDINFIEVMRALHRVGYDGMVMPDHIPAHSDPANRDQGFAFVYGYFRAIVQMLEAENS